MNNILIAMAIMSIIYSLPSAAAPTCPAILDHRVNTLLEQPADLCSYAGKVVMVVNTASYCGNTHQYAGLEALYHKEKANGLVILGFPSNDFGSQEPGSNKEIAKFCRLTYGVEFPMFEKTEVTASSANPLFKQLIAATGHAPQWNFHKYLISRDGKTILSFENTVDPADPVLVKQIQQMLAQKP
ncbi:glutathione peroxidase [Sulfuriferula nivalis]|uniref:Glutathione peroxidase n=1 Tax=Sulfuriferula nivalis TaxID=2675298 RepID=A0A809RJ96_9PROT|nr:glutathione peroxidase [Sulfuriferula nivalis]BBP00904.1 glutathione peroxidase [Sulfuriferula nivalis]